MLQDLLYILEGTSDLCLLAVPLPYLYLALLVFACIWPGSSCTCMYLPTYCWRICTPELLYSIGTKAKVGRGGAGSEVEAPICISRFYCTGHIGRGREGREDMEEQL